MTRRRRLPATSVAVTLVALAFASPAAASTVSMEEIVSPSGSLTGSFFFTAGPNEVNRVVMTFSPGNGVLVHDSAGILAAGRCSYPVESDNTTVSCQGTAGVPFGTANITLGTGNDTLLVRAVSGTIPTTSISAGAGNDRVTAGPGADTLYGGPGSDVLIGGAGNDILFGEFGPDRLYGGPGNDRLEGAFGNDRLYGGTGNDFLIGGANVDAIFPGPGRNRVVG